jgi:predicted metal-dependent HD superfamily phosphohydrolase
MNDSLTGFENWRRLCEQIGVRQTSANNLAVWGAHRILVQAYGKPERAFHNLGHIGHCLAELESCRDLVKHPVPVEFAIWFHDFVYDSGNPEKNEELSADAAGDMLLSLGAPKRARGRVRRLVLSTFHGKGSAPPDTADEMILSDIDLSILGQPKKAYNSYAKAIRQEFASVGDEAYRKGRAKFLSDMLLMDPLYMTDFFMGKYEEQARANMQMELDGLRA